MTDSVTVFPPGFRLTDTLGVPYNGASIEFYDALTTNARLVYSDQALLTVLGTIVYGDSAGYPVSAQGGTNKVLVYTNTGDYKVVIKDGSGVVIATHDAIKGAVISGGGGGGAAGITQAQADARYIRNANALVAATNVDATDLLPFWDTATSSNQGIRWDDFQTDLLSEWRTAGHIFPTGSTVRVAFQMTTPPVGWTKEVGAAYNDAVSRFTTGTAATGGATAFSTIFASRTFTGTVGNDTPSLAKTAAHAHGPGVGANFYGDNGGFSTIGSGATALGQISQTASAGSGTVHNHVLTMNAADFAVKFADFVIGIKT